jgi:tetratricopeptide (TPR) repeat protein
VSESKLNQQQPLELTQLECLLSSEQCSQIGAYVQQIVAVSRPDPDLMWQAARILKTRGYTEDALTCVDRLLQLFPHHLTVRAFAAQICRQMHWLDRAWLYVAQLPDKLSADYLLQRGLLQIAQQELESALETFQLLLKFDPNNVLGLLHMGVAALGVQQYELADRLLSKAEKLAPERIEPPFNRGLVAIQCVDYANAVTHFQRVLALDPLHEEGRFKLSFCYYHLNDLASADALCKKLLVDYPEHPLYLQAMGDIYSSIGELKLAESMYKCIENPSSSVQASLLYLELLRGHWQESWTIYDLWRQLLDERPPVTHLPHWDYVACSDQQLLIYTEHGLGDVIQFARFLPLLAQAGQPYVIWSHQPAMDRVLKLLPGVRHVYQRHETPEGDTILPLLDIVEYLQMTPNIIPSTPAYDFSGLRLPQLAVSSGKPKIGLVWASGKRMGLGLKRLYDLRSIPLQELALALSPWAEIAAFFSFQVGADSAQIGECNLLITDLSASLTDMYETARYLSQMDLVITVDTAVAHLAGVLGIPVWILLPHVPDWRWGLTGTTTPWYPSALLFRQQQWGGWSTVLKELESRCLLHPLVI